MGNSAGDMVAEANAAIDTMTIEDARKLVGNDDIVFLDVREKEEAAKGTIPGAVHVSRGWCELASDVPSGVDLVCR